MDSGMGGNELFQVWEVNIFLTGKEMDSIFSFCENVSNKWKKWFLERNNDHSSWSSFYEKIQSSILFPSFSLCLEERLLTDTALIVLPFPHSFSLWWISRWVKRESNKNYYFSSTNRGDGFYLMELHIIGIREGFRTEDEKLYESFLPFLGTWIVTFIFILYCSRHWSESNPLISLSWNFVSSLNFIADSFTSIVTGDIF